MRATGRTSGTSTVGGLLAAAVIATLALAGCGSGSDTATAPTSAPATTASSVTSTTADESTSSTETPGAVAGAATLGGTSDEDDRTGSGGATARTPEGSSDADEEAPDVTWAMTALDYRGDDGLWVAYDCPPDGTTGGVWGTDVYTDDSSVCSAAVHAGLIDEVDGGEVVIEIGAGRSSYDGSTANGITSSSYGSWDGSFTFVAP